MRPRKRFGQNFLHDQVIIHQIVQAINPQIDDCIVEIGAGQGALTIPLLEQVPHITAIEIDRDLVNQLQKIEHSNRLTILSQDALQFNFASVAKNNTIRIVGNLPYNISTPLLFHLLQFKDLITDMHFMLQKEVALSLIAQASDKDYSRISVIAKYFFDIDILLDVPPTAFFPAPKVTSSFIRMSARQEAVVDNLQPLDSIVKLAFSKRRKTLANALASIFDAQAWEAMQIDNCKRPDATSITEYLYMLEYLKKKDDKNGF